MRKSLLAASVVAIVATSLGGCVSILPKSKPSQLYRFGAETSEPSAAAQGHAKIGVVMGQVQFPRASTSDGMLTVTGDQTAYISGARWVAPARVLFGEAVQRAFLTKSTAVQLVNVGEVGPARAILSIQVNAFEVRYTGEGAPIVAISLVARMTGSDGRFLDERPFSIVQQAQANSVSMIVAAFNQGTDKVLTQLVTWSDDQALNVQAANVPLTVSTPIARPTPPNGQTSTSISTSTSTLHNTTTTPR